MGNRTGRGVMTPPVGPVGVWLAPLPHAGRRRPGPSGATRMSFPFSPDPADVPSARRLAEASGYLIPPSLLPAFQYARADRQGELWMPATWGVLRGGRWRPTSWEPVSDFVDTWLFVEHDQPGWLPPGRDGEV